MGDAVDTVLLSEIESVCPVCLEKITARRVMEGDDVFMFKECEEHGPFKTVLWRGHPAMAEWQRPKKAVYPETCYTLREKGCPFDCGLCSEHRQLPCSVVLEVTQRCDLHCAVCFADASHSKGQDPSLEKLSQHLEHAIAATGPCSLQLSGGEPTLRDDLPEIIRLALGVGYPFIQVNTNGVRLAADASFAKQLRETGLSTIFLQFDGTDDEVYRVLRGRELLDRKLQTIENCGNAGLGVILVPTLVRNVNTGLVGSIVRKAVQLSPVVRGVHFQPVSYFGRYPQEGREEGRFTLPELMRCLEEQTGGLIQVADLSPPGTEHSHCSFHATFTVTANGGLKPVGGQRNGSCCFADIGSSGVKGTIDTISSRWRMPSCDLSTGTDAALQPKGLCGNKGAAETDRSDSLPDFDTFLRQIALQSFTVSAMAFQDAYNLDLERLKGCCILVISPDGRLVPFCAYNLTGTDGKRLYRGNGSPR